MNGEALRVEAPMAAVRHPSRMWSSGTTRPDARTAAWMSNRQRARRSLEVGGREARRAAGVAVELHGQEPRGVAGVLPDDDPHARPCRRDGGRERRMEVGLSSAGSQSRSSSQRPISDAVRSAISTTRGRARAGIGGEAVVLTVTAIASPPASRAAATSGGAGRCAWRIRSTEISGVLAVGTVLRAWIHA